VMSISYQGVVNLIYKSLKYLRENMVTLSAMIMLCSWYQFT